jgi:hypothetical protein
MLWTSVRSRHDGSPTDTQADTNKFGCSPPGCCLLRSNKARAKQRIVHCILTIESEKKLLEHRLEHRLGQVPGIVQHADMQGGGGLDSITVYSARIHAS